MRRRHVMPFGAEVRDGQGVRFRLWAPGARQVAVRLEDIGRDDGIALAPRGDGWFDSVLPQALPGMRYRFVIDGEAAVPDPASRFQPDGVHGPSEIVDPRTYPWSDDGWRGLPFEAAVFYELHVGSFTPEGSFRGVARRLDHLVDLGVTAIELMPVAAFPGRWDWGYNGVYPFAPAAAYGRPEDLKALIDAAHRRGVMVFLDFVCNHFGPEGNYLHRYAPHFFNPAEPTPWGAAINFDGPDSRPVRDFFIESALFWLEEYHFDGLRLDAVHSIVDKSRPDVVAELAATVRGRIEGRRQVHLVLENDDNEAAYLRRDEQGRPVLYDAQWNDDWHHVLHVLTCGERDGYYADYAENPLDQLARSSASGFVYQGEVSHHRGGRRRGTRSGHLPPTAFIDFLQNHDQVGNRAFGERLRALAPRAAVEAATAVLLLQPAVPLLFMGEEWGTQQRFPFFCDLSEDLAESVREGRRSEFARFESFGAEALPDPLSVETFDAAKLDWREPGREPYRSTMAHMQALLAVRRREIVPRLTGGGAAGGGATGAGMTGRADLVAAGTLSAVWRLADGSRLRLLARFTDTPGDEPLPPPAGRPLYCSHEGIFVPAREECLPPWFVGWYLEEGADQAEPPEAGDA